LLRLAAAEQREEGVLVAAHPPRRGFLAVELVLLACGGLLELADLFSAAGIGRAAVKGLKLRFEAGAGFGTDTNQVTVLTRSGTEQALSGTKQEVARRILHLLLVPKP